ncbi:MAG TPA: indolepyruvate ferredoxin oxidoreductase family protein, partial [Noviherbaspirillum sp.]|nr:indolepyruvate ferredoxin oxidoreductase family protein [Noviherbaspirillum sp.]
YEGVFSLWYGKGPGVDRSGDALKHGNAYGSSPKGGVLVVAGDDHGCVSSSMPHQSDQAFMAWNMPFLHPASVSEYIEFGLYGWALSRFSGNWVGFKAISETVESASSITLPSQPVFHAPDDHRYPPGGLHYRWPDFPSLVIEERLSAKLDAVAAFARLNSIDRQIVTPRDARIGIVTCGKAHLDLMEALRLLGLDAAQLEELGVRIYKIGLTYPIEKTRLLEFVHGLQDVLVIEEKGPVLEQQIKSLLFNMPAATRPLVIGKTDEHGRAFVPSTGELSPSLLQPLLMRWLLKHFPSKRLPGYLDQCAIRSDGSDTVTTKRTPYYCSGCPHNASTVVPEGSRALAGIGCHFMAAWMERSTTGLTQMGGEGTDWIGQSLFTKTPHVFQNLGDGTYFHSGYLAIRQAIAARTNITYKILYNDAVAMTGGQPIDGKLTVPQIARQVTDEGACKVVVVTDDVGRYKSIDDMPPGVSIHDRSELDAVQRQLREISGVTVLIYDQMCAIEKRRRRKRGDIPDSQRTVLINAAVCEGCGDCGKTSNCVSILPLETEFGRKRVIDQSSCNKDFSCADGFCPSFVSVIGGTSKKPKKSVLQLDALHTLLQRYPAPAISALDGHYNILIAGIGGTGVVTVGTILAQAAHSEGKGASTLNFKGFAQKGGAVLNHIRLAANPASLTQNRIDRRQADAVLICDLVVGASDDVLGTIRHGHTVTIANQSEIATGQFTRDPDASIHAPSLTGKIRHAAGSDHVKLFDAQHYARLAFGDTIVANMLVAGYAWQRGSIPIGMASIEKAIRQSGVAVELNYKAFLLGRLLAADESAARSLLGEKGAVIQFIKRSSLENMVVSRMEFLRHYQNAAYADRYRRQISMIETLEKRLVPEGASLKLTETVAKYLFKVMTYKDEYEVARLFTDGQFEQQLRQQFDGTIKLQFHMAPPALFWRKSPRPTKLTFGPWMMSGMKLLARFRFLRGTIGDPFGYTSERRVERQLICEYEDMLAEFSASLTSDNLTLAIELAGLPETIRGYGHVKLT